MASLSFSGSQCWEMFVLFPLTLGLLELSVYMLCNSSSFSLILFVIALYVGEMLLQFFCSDFRRFLCKRSEVTMDVFCFLLEETFVPSC